MWTLKNIAKVVNITTTKKQTHRYRENPSGHPCRGREMEEQEVLTVGCKMGYKMSCST